MAGIEELKSKLISKGGLAMNNQFLVNLPSMGGVDSRTMNVLCKEVSLPEDRYLLLTDPSQWSKKKLLMDSQQRMCL